MFAGSFVDFAKYCRGCCCYNFVNSLNKFIKFQNFDFAETPRES